ncbi:MAG TPA: HEAT repeat domain-containing protein [archaeon]|nr:HEAT repeat domain-containing protein [archaeon]
MKKTNFIPLFALACLAGLFLSPGCGPKEDPELARERAMVTGGIEILRSGTAVQRDSVIRTLYKITNPQLLHVYLEDPDPNVQIGMVSALGYLKDKSAAPMLTELLRKVDDYLLQETIIYALGEINDTTSISTIIDLLEDDTVSRDLRLSIPITLASFAKTEASGRIEAAFIDILEKHGDDIELCSYVAVGILEIIKPGNVELFRPYLPLLRQMAEKRKAAAGEDGIWTNFQLTIQELENYQAPAS